MRLRGCSHATTTAMRRPRPDYLGYLAPLRGPVGASSMALMVYQRTHPKGGEQQNPLVSLRMFAPMRMDDDGCVSYLAVVPGPAVCWSKILQHYPYSSLSIFNWKAGYSSWWRFQFQIFLLSGSHSERSSLQFRNCSHRTSLAGFVQQRSVRRLVVSNVSPTPAKEHDHQNTNHHISAG